MPGSGSIDPPGTARGLARMAFVFQQRHEVHGRPRVHSPGFIAATDERWGNQALAELFKRFGF